MYRLSSNPCPYRLPANRKAVASILEQPAAGPELPLVADTGSEKICRGLPTGAQHFEIESLSVHALSGATHSVINDRNLSGSAGTQLNATGTGEYVTYTVPVSAAGSYDVKVGVKISANSGIFELSIGGLARGKPQDEYRSQAGYNVRDLGVLTFSSGGNKAFQFLVSGKNASSGGYSLAFDYIELVPTIRLEAESLQVQSITPAPSGYTSAQWFGVFNAAVASGGAGTFSMPSPRLTTSPTPFLLLESVLTGCRSAFRQRRTKGSFSSPLTV